MEDKKIDVIHYHKMLFITNAIEDGWSEKKRIAYMFFQKNTTINERFTKKNI